MIYLFMMDYSAIFKSIVLKKLNLRKILNIFDAPKGITIWIEKDFPDFDKITYRNKTCTYNVEDPESSLGFGDWLVAKCERKIDRIEIWEVQEIEIEISPGRVEKSHTASGPIPTKGIRRGVLKGIQSKR